MSDDEITLPRRTLRRGIELGFRDGKPLIYDGTEPVAIDAQAGKGKLTRFFGVNLVSPRTAHLSKIITDPKDAELAWVSWKTLERQGYRVRFINPQRLYGYPSESFNFNTRLLAIAARPALRPLVGEPAQAAGCCPPPGYLAGVIEGLAYANYQAANQNADGMDCIKNWFYKTVGTPAKVLSALESFPEYAPGAVLYAMIQKECG